MSYTRIANRGGRGVRSPVEVTNISKHGFWLLLDKEELFVPFKQFPWFKGASVSEILNPARPCGEKANRGC